LAERTGAGARGMETQLKEVAERAKDNSAAMEGMRSALNSILEGIGKIQASAESTARSLQERRLEADGMGKSLDGQAGKAAAAAAGSRSIRDGLGTIAAAVRVFAKAAEQTAVRSESLRQGIASLRRQNQDVMEASHRQARVSEALGSIAQRYKE